MSKLKARNLIDQYLRGSADQTEKAIVESWFNSLAESAGHTGEAQDLYTVKKEMWLELTKARKPFHQYVKLFQVISAAAVFLILISFGINKIINSTENQDVPYAAHIAPAGNFATLTLDNGKRISLDPSSNLTMLKKDVRAISKASRGILVYNFAKDKPSKQSVKPSYNTIETPKGGHYQVVLPDGTKVWLNAASSIRFPTHFESSERLVELSGEGYFEVAKDPEHPFKLISAHQAITVLGTHFNLSSYADEADTKTTLLEGSVRVENLNSHSRAQLKPGEQLILNHNKMIVSQENIADAVAWKDNYFRFSDESLGNIMRRLSRWYNVDVVFKGMPVEEGFSGRISTDNNIADVLNMLQKTKLVHFRIEGRRVIVMK